MSVRRSLILLTFLTFLIPVGAFYFRSSQAEQRAEQQEDRLRNLDLYTVERGRVERIVPAIGEIEADEVVSHSFLIPGTIAEIYVEEGQFILAGTELMRLNNQAERLAYENALLALELAELQLTDLIEIDEYDVRRAEAAVVRAQGSYTNIANSVTEDEIRAAELQVIQAQEQLEGAENARRIAGGLDQEALDLLNAQIGESSFNLATAQLRLQQLRDINALDLNAAGADIASAQREQERVVAGATDFQIQRAELAIESAQQDLEEAETNFNRTVLKAKIDGLVSAVDIEIGEPVMIGLPVAEMVDVDPLFITAEVDEVDIRAIEEGLSARVELDALPQTVLPATLDRVSLLGVNEGGIVSYNVRVTLDQIDPRIRVGMSAEANVVVNAIEDVLVVPNIYLTLSREEGKGTVSLLQPDGTVETVEVEIGLQGQETSQIVSGVEAGDILVIDLSGDSFSFFG